MGHHGKIYLSVGEEEILELLTTEFKQSYLVALSHVINEKRSRAFQYANSGRQDIANQILKEIDEKQ